MEQFPGGFPHVFALRRAQYFQVEKFEVSSAEPLRGPFCITPVPPHATAVPPILKKNKVAAGPWHIIHHFISTRRSDVMICSAPVSLILQCDSLWFFDVFRVWTFGRFLNQGCEMKPQVAPCKILWPKRRCSKRRPWSYQGKCFNDVQESGFSDLAISFMVFLVSFFFLKDLVL